MKMASSHFQCCWVRSVYSCPEGTMKNVLRSLADGLHVSQSVWSRKSVRVTAVEVLNLALCVPVLSICCVSSEAEMGWGGGKNLFCLYAPFSSCSLLINPAGLSVSGCNRGSSFPQRIRSASAESLTQSRIASAFFTFRCFLWKKRKKVLFMWMLEWFLNAEENKGLTCWFYSVTEDLRLSLLLHPS